MDSKHPTYAERRERLIEQVLRGQSTSFAITLAEVTNHPDAPSDEQDAEAIALGLTYLRLMRGRDESATKFMRGLKPETLKKWRDALSTKRQAWMESIRKWRPNYEPPESTRLTDEEIAKCSARLLEAQNELERAQQKVYRTQYEYMKSYNRYCNIFV